MADNEKCFVCPRKCGADRSEKFGICGVGEKIKIASYSLHKWEEPCICQGAGAGAVFFSGCPLKCVFCQNHEISHTGAGKEISDDELLDIFFRLEELGACNIDLVSPTQFSKRLYPILERAKKKLKIPIVYNCSGYESVGTLKSLAGLIDIYLPDFKYFSYELAKKYSGVSDYRKVALSAIGEMLSQVSYPSFDKDGKMLSGVMIRHMVLPGQKKDSFAVIDALTENFDAERLYLSLMCQYFPTHDAYKFPEINRRLTTLEYERVVQYALSRGITHGYTQDISSARKEYVPDFFLAK